MRRALRRRGLLPALAHYFPLIEARLEELPRVEIQTYVDVVESLPPIGHTVMLVASEGG